ncbi:hypothetical protein AMELA_G00270370 [Ameiurus melas]|uniref:Uncharacterized protein n=1 Tax=Ameiurus melas TaxID=219545 RepID=A0A7J5ZNC6_AMEME|nr:hypothetical protein AMELA_G00270370 [Ameiurus melas]
MRHFVPRGLQSSSATHFTNCRFTKGFSCSLNIEDITARWPALFEAPHIQDEFHRITMVQLESKFMSKLDEYTHRLLKLFQSKCAIMGLRLQAILLKVSFNEYYVC